DLGVDAVEIHVLEARLRIVRARAHVLVREPVGLELLRLAAGGGVEPDRAGDLRIDDPEVALRGRLDARRAVPQRPGCDLRPEILRRIDVRVGRDDALVRHDRAPPRWGRY